jgi:hypothetical protein
MSPDIPGITVSGMMQQFSEHIGSLELSGFNINLQVNTITENRFVYPRDVYCDVMM